MSLAALDAALGFEGMKEEVQNLEKCATGIAMREHEIMSLKAKFPALRVIGWRWVAAFKSDTRVHCRIVAKDLARGTSANSLGYTIGIVMWLPSTLATPSRTVRTEDATQRFS